MTFRRTIHPWLPVLAAALAFLIAAVAPAPAAAKSRALLVGVSSYRHLEPAKWLRAPANDVRRMRALLSARGLRDEDIAILADGVEGSRGEPTAAAITQAFAALVAAAERDDQIVIYLSGHGTQIPDDNGDEDDGFDEAFLPSDAIPPPAGAARFDMDNVIRDDKIGETIDALRARGAHVWLVVDSCHSGTISRAMSTEARAKELSAADFSLAANPAPAAPKSMVDAPARRAKDGSLVAFYASQSDEISLEIAVPRGAPPQRQSWVSAFTDAMIEALQRPGVTTYRDLLDETARTMRAQIPPRTRQTPGQDGDGLDRAILGERGGERERGLSVEGERVLGGAIAGLEPGTVLALHARGDDAPLAHGQVVAAEALDARIVTVQFPCEVADGVPVCARSGEAVPAAARTARVTMPVTRMTLRVSRPRDWPGRPATADRSAAEAAALARIAAAGPYAIDDAAADFVWYRTPDGGRLMPSWIAPDSEEFGPAFSLAGSAEEAAERAVAALDRARLLMRLERIRTALPSHALPIGVASVQTRLVRYGRDDAGRCRFSGPRADLEKSAAARTCDGVSVQIRNGGTAPVFAYVFALDDSWMLVPLNNACRQGAQTRIDIGGQRTVDLQYRNGAIAPGLAPQTRNGVVTFAVPFEPGVALPFDPCQLIRAMAAGAARSAAADDPLAQLHQPRRDTRAGGAGAAGEFVMSVETWTVDQSGRQ